MQTDKLPLKQSSSQSEIAINSQHTHFSIFKCHATKCILPPLISEPQEELQLPLPQEIFTSQISTEKTSEEKSTLSIVESVDLHFPILSMLLKEARPLHERTKPTELDSLLAPARLKKQVKGVECAVNSFKRLRERSRSAISGSQRPAIYYQQVKSDHTDQLQESIIYRVAYREGFRHSLKFKLIRLSVPLRITVEQFTSFFLAQVGSASLIFEKSVFIEKERDLIPLINMSQLSTKQINFLHIRKEKEEETVFEKPILLKKRNVPDIGMTLLSQNEPKIRFIKERCPIIELESSLESCHQEEILKLSSFSDS